MSTDALASTQSPWERFRTLLSLIRFSHTLFALPWAFAGLFFGAEGWPSLRVFLWVLVAMVSARTAAMTFNRLADRHLDATNPRTKARPSVTGEVSPTAMIVMIVVASGLFLFAASSLNPLCGLLALPTLVVLLAYSLTKRFTSAAHFVLGVALGLSPLGAYLATKGTFDQAALFPALVGAAVLFWTAGFDVLYACQDLEHDRREGLLSVPAKFGVSGALWIARAAHVLVPVSLALAGVVGGMGWIYFSALGVVVLLLAVEHRMVKPTDLSRVNLAFFQVNVTIAFLMSLAIIIEVLLAGGDR